MSFEGEEEGRVGWGNLGRISVSIVYIFMQVRLQRRLIMSVVHLGIHYTGSNSFLVRYSLVWLTATSLQSNVDYTQITPLWGNLGISISSLKFVKTRCSSLSQWHKIEELISESVKIKF